MEHNKIIRSICYFSDEINDDLFKRLDQLALRLEENNFIIQTRRVCLQGYPIQTVDQGIHDDSLFIGVGTLTREQIQEQFNDFLNAGNLSFNLDITQHVTLDDVHMLFDIIQQNASKTFNFTFAVNNPDSSPFFPSANFERTGFSVGLQATDLSMGCDTVQAWLERMVTVWDELMDLFGDTEEFLGIDSSVAPLFDGDSSFINFIERVHHPFPQAVTTPVFTQISDWIKTHNPKPVGLCGLMFPCLEDAHLAHHYQNGDFSIERNLFLSLHCGLGIDTYPIGIDENPERVLAVLQLLRALSNRYQKPLSARFISDGKAKIGQQTDLQNQYLQDVIVRPL